MFLNESGYMSRLKNKAEDNKRARYKSYVQKARQTGLATKNAQHKIPPPTNKEIISIYVKSRTKERTEKSNIKE